MVTTGFTLAVLSATGLYLVYRKLPRRVRRFMQKHVLLTDFVAMLLTYAILGNTIVGLVAAAFMGIMTSIMLALVNNPGCAALLERLAAKVGQAQAGFINWVGSLADIPEEEKTQLEVVK